FSLLSVVRQCIRDNIVAHLRAKRTVTTRRDDNVLLAIHFIGHRRCLSTGWQTALPQFLTVGHVVRAQVVICGCRDEQHVTGGGDWATQHWHTHIERHWNRHRERHAVLWRTNTFLPDDLVGLQIQTGDVTPGRLFTRQTERRKERIQGHTIRNAILRLDTGFGTAAFRIFRLLHWVTRTTRDQAGNERQRHWVSDGDLTVRVNGDPTPFEHPQVTREDQRTLL